MLDDSKIIGTVQSWGVLERGAFTFSRGLGRQTVSWVRRTGTHVGDLGPLRERATVDITDPLRRQARRSPDEHWRLFQGHGDRDTGWTLRDTRKRTGYEGDPRSEEHTSELQ